MIGQEESLNCFESLSLSSKPIEQLILPFPSVLGPLFLIRKMLWDRKQLSSTLKAVSAGLIIKSM